MTETIHVCRGTGRRYRAMVRLAGFRNWTPCGPWRQNYMTTVLELARSFAKDRNWKRGAVWFISDYYDPVSVLEMKR